MKPFEGWTKLLYIVAMIPIHKAIKPRRRKAIDNKKKYNYDQSVPILILTKTLWKTNTKTLNIPQWENKLVV